MTVELAMIGIALALFAILAIIALPAPLPRPTYRHRGLELMAKDGELVHVRETESEREP